MINVLEYSKLPFSSMPDYWQDDTFKKKFSGFLQTNWNQRNLLMTDSNKSKCQQFLSFDFNGNISTNNYIGTIVYKGTQINILPKIFLDQKASEISIEEFYSDLAIWLKYSLFKSYPFLKQLTGETTDKSLFEVFSGIYINLVDHVLKKQPYYSYENKEESSQIVKGSIKFNNYILNSFSKGKPHEIAYSYSDFTFDNLINRIIKTTCRFIYSETLSDKTRRKIRIILAKLSAVSDIPATANDCNKIAIDKLHKDYSIIKSLSKIFLMNKTPLPNNSSNENFCFLFPAEFLFESFVGNYIKDTFEHDFDKISLQNQTHFTGHWVLNGSPIRAAFPIREDIIIFDKKRTIVLDTKYKLIGKIDRVSSNDLFIDESDIYQMINYALQNKTCEIILLYPLASKEPVQQESLYLSVQSMSDLGNISIHIQKIPFVFSGSEENLNVLKTIFEELLK